MVAAGAAEEAREAAEAAPRAPPGRRSASSSCWRGTTPRRPPDEVEAIKAAHRRYARRQLTWMRRMEGVTLIDRTGLDDAEVARRVVELLQQGPRVAHG